MAEHSDSFSKQAPAAEQTTAPSPATAPKSTSNDAQTAKAIAEREREFMAGGDGSEDAATSQGSKAIEAIDALVTRVRGLERPSPFGTSYFPPLPAPPDRR